MDIQTFTKTYSPCGDAKEYLDTQSSLREAWDNCDNITWMTWALCKIGGFERLLIQFACTAIRETPLTDGRKVWDLLEDQRSKDAVETVEHWLKGETTQDEVNAATDAARASRAASRASRAASRASRAASRASRASRAAAYAAAYAADAARAATDAAAYAAAYAADAAQVKMLRDLIPFDMIEIKLSSQEKVG